MDVVTLQVFRDREEPCTDICYSSNYGHHDYYSYDYYRRARDARALQSAAESRDLDESDSRRVYQICGILSYICHTPHVRGSKLPGIKDVAECPKGILPSVPIRQCS